jgi:hypothetical protein
MFHLVGRASSFKQSRARAGAMTSRARSLTLQTNPLKENASGFPAHEIAFSNHTCWRFLPADNIFFSPFNSPANL